MITEKKRRTPLPETAHIAALDDRDIVPLADAYQAGELIADKYRLLRLLGQGGMGVVWLARNLALDSDVAIKLLRAGEKSERLERRMLKEAQSVARLGHPAILRVFDFGSTRHGDPYMVMELLAGEDLAKTLDRNGRLSATKAVRTLLPILHALGTAHQKGIIHRDLKPDNIFLNTTDSGYVQPKLVDFGIVKTDAPEVDRLTRMGTVLGTPAYLSPEQARGQDVDQKADIWSAAVVLYEMVTCRLPFDGGNYNALMRSIIEDSPPPITSFGAGDAELWAIVARGLAKSAALRWPNMSAFGSALAHWLLSRGETDDISGASLRTAWLQGPIATRPEDLYSAPPLAEDGAPARAVTDSAAPAATIADRELATGGAYAVTFTAPRRRFWLLTSATVLMTFAGIGLAAKPPFESETRAVPAALMVPAPSEPARDSWPQAKSAGEAPPVPVKEEHVEMPATHVPVLKQAGPKAPSGADAPAPRQRAGTGKVRPRVHSGARPEDLKTSL
jgi:eukaryotic-like serine/threonine-protein kinase